VVALPFRYVATSLGGPPGVSSPQANDADGGGGDIGTLNKNPTIRAFRCAEWAPGGPPSRWWFGPGAPPAAAGCGNTSQPLICPDG